MDTTELPNPRKIVELMNDIDKFSLIALRDMNLKQITVEFLQEVTTDIVWDLDITSDSVGAFCYRIGMVMDVMNTKAFPEDFNVLLLLVTKTRKVHEELKKIKPKEDEEDRNNNT